MNKTQKAAMLTMLSLAAVSCQKEDIVDNDIATIVAESHSVYKMQYTVDGVQHQVVLHGEKEYSEFIYRMLALAEEGHRVSFYDESKVQYNLSKDTVIYTTKNKDDAYAWTQTMMSNGYTVAVEFDSSTGVYTCTATK